MMHCMLRLTAMTGFMPAPCCATAQVSAGASPAGEFVLLNQWKSAVLAGHAAAKFLYSTMTPQALLAFSMSGRQRGADAVVPAAKCVGSFALKSAAQDDKADYLPIYHIVVT